MCGGSLRPGTDTLLSISQAGPELQAKLLEGLGLKGYLITDARNPNVRHLVPPNSIFLINDFFAERICLMLIFLCTFSFGRSCLDFIFFLFSPDILLSLNHMWVQSLAFIVNRF